MGGFLRARPSFIRSVVVCSLNLESLAQFLGKKGSVVRVCAEARSGKPRRIPDPLLNFG